MRGGEGTLRRIGRCFARPLTPPSFSNLAQAERLQAESANALAALRSSTSQLKENVTSFLIQFTPRLHEALSSFLRLRSELYHAIAQQTDSVQALTLNGASAIAEAQERVREMQPRTSLAAATVSAQEPQQESPQVGATEASA